jgi:acetyl esterase/lipase
MPLLLNLHHQTARLGQPAQPVVVAIHGGSFRRGSRDDANLAAMARQIVPAGFTVMSVGYRLVPDEPVLTGPFDALVEPFEQAQPVLRARSRASFEAMLAASEDLAKVLRWISAHAGEYGLDPDRVFLLGSSAGAIAALNTVYGLPQRSIGDTGVRIAGVINLWGALPAVDALPADGPPLLIIHGDKDQTVDVEAARKLVRMAATAGVPYTAYIMPDRLHGFGGNPPLTTEVAPGISICSAVVAFLRKAAALPARSH